jgi:hypothetical protein
MALSVDCPACGAHYNVGENMAGKKARCKKCGAVMPIPAVVGDEGDDDALAALAEVAAVQGDGPRRGAARGASGGPPAGWTPESVIIERERNPPPSAAIGSGRWQRKGGGIGRFLKPVLLLAVLGGVGYGGWYAYNQYSGSGLVASAKDKLLGGKKEPDKPRADPDQPPRPGEAELKRNESAEHLRAIFAALTAYTGRNNGNWPPDLATLRQDGALSEEAVKSPFGPAFATGDYVYNPYVPQAPASPDAVLAHDAAELAGGDGASVLFADGTVRWLDMQGVQSALRLSEEQRASAVRQREEQAALARQQDRQRLEQQRRMASDAEQRRADIDPNYRPASRRDVAERVEAGAGGLARAVQDVAMRRGAEQLVRPITPGGSYAVIVRNQQGDAVEIFDGKATEPVAAAQFQTDPQFRNNPGAYALSPDGKLVARLVSFPNLKAAVYSVDAKSDLVSIDLEDKYGEPTLVGFIAPDRFVVRWTKYGNSGVEVWDAKAGRRGRQTDLFQVVPQPSPGSEAVSPDGRTYAVVNQSGGATAVRPPRGAAAAAPGQMQIALYDLVAGGQPRRFLVTGLENVHGVQPAGLAFSPDKTRIAGLFVDPLGRAVVLEWSMANGKVIGGDHVVPDKLDVPRTGFGRTRALDWVAGGRGLLVAGRIIMNPDTGATLATLDAGRVIGQAVTNETTVHLGYGDLNQIQGVAVVPLDESKFPAKPAAPGRVLAAPQR